MGMSNVQICNMALSRIGVKRISALTDANKTARECNSIFEVTRDSVLADHDWGFARLRQDLGLLTDTYSGYTYAYAYPSGCLNFRKIFDGLGAATGTSYDIDTDSFKDTREVEFDIILSTAKNAKVIVTDRATAEGIFTVRVTDPNMFSFPFVDAFAFRLASDLAMPLTGKITLQESMARSYLIRIGSAGAQSANESYTAPTDDSSFSRMRS